MEAWEADDDMFERIQIEEAMRRSMQNEPGQASSGSAALREPARHDESRPSNVLHEIVDVAVHTRPNNSRRGCISGSLCIIRQAGKEFLMWNPSDAGTSRDNSYAINYPLADIASMLIGKKCYLIMTLKDGTTMLPLYFGDASAPIPSFLSCLSAYGFGPTPENPNVYVHNPPQHLVRSLEGLGMSSPGQEARWSLFEKFAKVTKFAREHILEPTAANLAGGGTGHKPQSTSPKPVRAQQPHRPQRQQTPPQSRRHSGAASTRRPASQRASTQQLVEEDRVAAIAATASKKNENIKCLQQTDLGDLGTFDVIATKRPIGPLPSCKRGPPITAQEVEAFFDHRGVLTREAELRAQLFRRGASEEIRPRVWRLLLGFCCADKPEDFAAFEEAKASEYRLMKQQWTSITPAQLRRNDRWRDVKNRIKKDVDRTDRVVDVFRSDTSPLLRTLSDILTTYCVYNADLSYVQGMSDLLAVTIRVVQAEVDTFWCFASLMDRVERKFQLDQLAMSEYLQDLACLCRFLDPDFMEYLEKNDSEGFFFAFRWLLLSFKREFEFDAVCTLWEAIWSEHLTPHLEVFVCLAILDLNKETIMALGLGFDEILHFVNELSGSLDVHEVLSRAELLWHRLAQCHQQLPEQLRRLVK